MQRVDFPLWPIIPGDPPTCGCGNASCKRVGKHPAVAWGNLKYGDHKPLHPNGAGVGLKTGAAPKGSDVFVVDLDGPESVNAWDALGGCGPTMTVETPRGWHLYFQHPGFPVKTSAGILAKGIDIRGEGGFVVAPGSPHRSGGKYEQITEDDIEPAPAPAWLIDWLKAQAAKAPAEVQTYPGDVEGEELDYNARLFTDYLKTAPPCIEGQAGDTQLFRVVQRGAFDYSLPIETVFNLIALQYNPRCLPPWSEDELRERVYHKAKDAKLHSTKPQAPPLPADLAHLANPTTPALPPIQPANSEIFWDDWDRPVEPPIYLVDGLIPISTVGMLVAHGSSLKTWTALDIGRAIAKGVPWLDRFVTRKGRVLVLDYESGLYELRRRIFLLERGKVPGLGAWAYPHMRIDDPELWKRLIYMDLSLVVLDSLSAGAPGVDENDTAAANPLKLAARFTEASNSGVLVIHHSKKSEGNDRTMVRGSTALYADCDWAYKFDDVEETSTYRRMRMVCIKPSMGKKPPPVNIELTDSGLSTFEVVNNTPLPKHATPEQIQDHILLKLAARGNIETKDAIAGALNLSAQKVRPQVDVLYKRGDIANVPELGYVLDNPEKRLQRIQTLTQSGEHFRSETDLAKAAGVPKERVEELIRKGVLTRSAEGRFLVIFR